MIDRALGFLGSELRHEVPIGPMTTYRVGGAARRFVVPSDPGQLDRIVEALAAADLGGHVLCVGRGSNLLVADAGFDGLAVHLGEAFTQVHISGETVAAGAAVALPLLARRSVAAGLTGFEWAVGVPGSMGGAVVMNAGGHGSDMAATTTGIRVHDLDTGETLAMGAEELRFGYRSSALGSQHIVSRVEMRLEPGSVQRGTATLAEIVRWRRENQPGGQNAGSVFTNPPAESAGNLIERAGAKGMRLGTAEVSTKHANFIQADPGGSADDIRALMDSVADRVRSACGVELRAETRLVGFAR